MKIACLGWGSLIYDRGSLPIQGEWFNDGPFAPVEFTRQSKDGRITLVVDPKAAPIQLLWALLNLTDLLSAREALKQCEGITATNWFSRNRVVAKERNCTWYDSRVTGVGGGTWL